MKRQIRLMRIMVIAFILAAFIVPSLPAFHIELPEVKLADLHLPGARVDLGAQPVEADSVDLYWVGGTGDWSQTAHWSTSNGGAGGHAVPTATNNVFFTSNSFGSSGQIVTFSASTMVCKNLDWTGAGAKAPIFRFNASSTVDFYVYGNIVNEAGVSWDRGQYGAFNVRLSATGTINAWTWTSSYSASAIYPSQTYINPGAGNHITLNSDVVFGPVTLSSGDIQTNGNTLTIWGTFTGAQTFGDTVVLGANPTSLGGNGGATGACTFNNLTFGLWNKHDNLNFSANQVINGTLNSTNTTAANHLMIKSNNTVQRTLTAAVVSLAHCDFQYINGAGAGDWDLSSAGEDSIDFTNNNNITFTFPYNSGARNLYWIGLDDGVVGSGYWPNQYEWSTASGGVGGAARQIIPDSNDDCYFDANSGFSIGNQTIMWSGVDSEIVPVHSLDFTGCDALAAPIWYDASGNYYPIFVVYGDLTLVPGMVFAGTGMVHDWGDTLRFANAGNHTFTTANNVELPALQISGTSGTLTIVGDLYTTNGFTHTSGALDTVTNSSMIYLSYSPICDSNSITVRVDTTYYGLYWQTDGTGRVLTINGSATWGAGGFTVLGGNGFTDTLKFSGNQTFNGPVTWTGYNGTRRLQVQSTVLGTQRQLTANNTLDITNCDISDLAGVGVTTWDISAGNNSDMGGNLGIIFTTGFYVYWVGNSGNWSDPAHWSYTSGGLGGFARIPLIQDIAVFDTNSFSIPGRTVTIDITNLSGIDASAVTNTPTITKSGTVDIYGDVNLGTVTYTVTTTNIKGLDTTLASSSTLTTNLYVLKNSYFMNSLVLVSNVNVAGTVYPQSGVFNHTIYNLTCTAYDSSTTTYDRIIRLGTGVLTLNGTGVITKLNMAATKLTLYCETSTIIFTNSGVSTQTFTPASLTYYNISIAGAGDYILTIGSSFTTNSISFDRTVANKTISGNYTVTLGASGLNFVPSGVRTITITNTDFTMASGVVLGDYLVITGSSAAGGAAFFASVGGHSTNGGTNAGWVWTAPTAPTILTVAASDVTPMGERLNGNLLTVGSYTIFYCYFEYGPTVAYGFTTPETTKTAIGTFNQYLTPYKTYHYRAVVRFGLNDHAYGNDAQVSISGAVGQAKAAVSDPGTTQGQALVSSAPNAIPRMYDEGSTGGLFGLGPVFSGALGAADIPTEVFWYPIAFIVALVLGFIVYGLTRTILLQAIVSAVVMAGFAGGGVLGNGLLPYWTVLIFLIEALLIWLIQEKQSI